GLPLNHELTVRQATFVCRTATTSCYRLYALRGSGAVQRPGLIRTTEQGAAIEVEIWSMPAAAFGSFIKNVPAPLAIGKIEIESGEWVTGFVCEGYAVADAMDITAYGGWRRFVEIELGGKG